MIGVSAIIHAPHIFIEFVCEDDSHGRQHLYVASLGQDVLIAWNFPIKIIELLLIPLLSDDVWTAQRRNPLDVTFLSPLHQYLLRSPLLFRQSRLLIFKRQLLSTLLRLGEFLLGIFDRSTLLVEVL